MEIAKKLYDEDLTPGQLCLQLLESGKKFFPDFYRSDLQEEFNKIWDFQKQFNLFSFCDVAKEEVKGKNKSQTWAILAKYFVETKKVNVWNDMRLKQRIEKKCINLLALSGR